MDSYTETEFKANFATILNPGSADIIIGKSLFNDFIVTNDALDILEYAFKYSKVPVLSSTVLYKLCSVNKVRLIKCYLKNQPESSDNIYQKIIAKNLVSLLRTLPPMSSAVSHTPLRKSIMNGLVKMVEYLITTYNYDYIDEQEMFNVIITCQCNRMMKTYLRHTHVDITKKQIITSFKLGNVDNVYTLVQYKIMYSNEFNYSFEDKKLQSCITSAINTALINMLNDKIKDDSIYYRKKIDDLTSMIVPTPKYDELMSSHKERKTIISQTIKAAIHADHTVNDNVTPPGINIISLQLVVETMSNGVTINMVCKLCKKAPNSFTALKLQSYKKYLEDPTKFLLDTVHILEEHTPRTFMVKYIKHNDEIAKKLLEVQKHNKSLKETLEKISSVL